MFSCDFYYEIFAHSLGGTCWKSSFFILTTLHARFLRILCETKPHAGHVIPKGQSQRASGTHIYLLTSFALSRRLFMRQGATSQLSSRHMCMFIWQPERRNETALYDDCQNKSCVKSPYINLLGYYIPYQYFICMVAQQWQVRQI